MLDPCFGYEASLPADVAGSGRERAVRDRYRVLWNVYVDGRLVESGALPEGTRRERMREFAGTFPHLGIGAGEAFTRFFDGRGLRHAGLMAFASAGAVGMTADQASGAGRSEVPIR
jgi:hypothetical protein